MTLPTVMVRTYSTSEVDNVVDLDRFILLAVMTRILFLQQLLCRREESKPDWRHTADRDGDETANPPLI